jgi:N-acyl-D-amino-acid deacylase
MGFIRAAAPLAFAAIMPATAAAQARADAPASFDVLITGAHVLDGTGNPWFLADIGLRGDEIAAIGDLSGAQAALVVDARGRVVAPGFIDLHTHAGGQALIDAGEPRRRTAPNLIAQGITTVVINSDGRSAWPIAEQRTALEGTDFGPNAIMLVGHGTVRSAVMGRDFQRPATAQEIAAMRRLVRQGMAEGAYGLSAGLEYSPGRWSETGEVVALVEEIVPFGGVYISHQRSEGTTPMWHWPSRDASDPPDLLASVRETIEIGERTGATVVASHIKVKGVDAFGASAKVIELIEQARARGVQVYADQYPYATSGSDGNVRLIPEWARDEGRRLAGDARVSITEAVRHVLADADAAARLRRDVTHEIDRRGGAERLVILDAPDAALIGRNVAELAAERGVTPLEMAFLLQEEGNPAWRGGVRKRGFSLDEHDIEEFARQTWTATASDAGVTLPGANRVHARLYGAFPRKIHRYALERGVITVEHAIRSATSLPAQILGLRDRGLLREGYRADLVILDLDRLRDRSTFFDSHQYPDGVDWVFVNGEPVVADGELTWRRPGRVLVPGF